MAKAAFVKVNAFSKKDIKGNFWRPGANGVLPAYVASGTLHGRGREGWNRILYCFYGLDSWGLCKAVAAVDAVRGITFPASFENVACFLRKEFCSRHQSFREALVRSGCLIALEF
jgi:hypothetical protein